MPSKQPVPAALAGAHTSYAAELIRVIDGDTFEARVSIWPGVEVTTKVRLRGIDAPELKARCQNEAARAQAAREALAQLLAQGGIAIEEVANDKYGGRILARASSSGTPDLAAAMIASGLARPYAGGRRQSWCD